MEIILDLRSSLFALFVFNSSYGYGGGGLVLQHFTYLLSEVHTGWRFVDGFFTIQQQQKSFNFTHIEWGV
jgi:hypothetical protein